MKLKAPLPQDLTSRNLLELSKLPFEGPTALRKCILCQLPLLPSEKNKSHRSCLILKRKNTARRRQSKAARESWRKLDRKRV